MESTRGIESSLARHESIAAMFNHVGNTGSTPAGITNEDQSPGLT